MEKLEGCDERALVLDGDHLEALRWGAVEARFPVSELDLAKVIRDDKGKTLGLFGKAEERVRISFGRLPTAVWVPLERQSEAESFASKADAAIAPANPEARPAERDGS